MGDHAPADFQPADIRLHGRHDTGRLVAGDMRQGGQAGQPVRDVQVGAADAAGARLHQDFVRPDHRLRHALDLKRPATFFVYGCFQIESVPEPVRDEDEVLVQTHTCGICSTDLHIPDGLACPPCRISPATSRRVSCRRGGECPRAGSRHGRGPPFVPLE